MASPLERALAELVPADAGLNRMMGSLLPLRSIPEPGISNDESLKRLHGCREQMKRLSHGAYDDAIKDAWIVEEIEVPSLVGGSPVRVRMHKPASGGSGLPLAVWTHGGGLTIGDYKDNAPGMFKPLLASNMCWASVEYRLAPEAQFPAPVDDTLAAFVALSSPNMAAKYGYDLAKIGFAGVSAGGFLAGHAACRAGLSGKVPAFLAMLYPMVEPMTKRQSFNKYGVLDVCPGNWVEWSWKQTLADANGPMSESRKNEANLLCADWAPLKAVPTLLVTGQADALHDEGIALGELLKRVGLPVEMLDPKGSHTVAHMHDERAINAITTWMDACLSSARSRI